MVRVKARTSKPQGKLEEGEIVVQSSPAPRKGGTDHIPFIAGRERGDTAEGAKRRVACGGGEGRPGSFCMRGVTQTGQGKIGASWGGAQHCSVGS